MPQAEEEPAEVHGKVCLSCRLLFGLPVHDDTDSSLFDNSWVVLQYMVEAGHGKLSSASNEHNIH